MINKLIFRILNKRIDSINDEWLKEGFRNNNDFIYKVKLSVV